LEASLGTVEFQSRSARQAHTARAELLASDLLANPKCSDGVPDLDDLAGDLVATNEWQFDLSEPGSVGLILATDTAGKHFDKQIQRSGGGDGPVLDHECPGRVGRPDLQ
jgi:hypothetical protein